jgi:predicted MFS family arabinose efflux permease
MDSARSSPPVPAPALARAIEARFFRGRSHFAWFALAVIFLVMLVTAGMRSAPGVLIVPLERDLGWSRATISAALALNLALFGLMGPFAAAAMLRFGARRTALLALALVAFAVAISSRMQSTWQLQLLWGVIVGCASGATSTTFGATLVSRWFVERRGLAMGVLSASSATGQLMFLPLLAWIAARWGWQPVVLAVSGAVAVVFALVALLLPEQPASLSLRALGAPQGAAAPVPPARNPITSALATLFECSRDRDFWLLFLTFFVCGASTNGYIGTHFIAMCGDEGLAAVDGAGLLAVMGLCDLVGTTLSGWLSDRHDPRALLFWYYGLRAVALLFLPYAFGMGAAGLSIFALVYGLDWVATVPPTVRIVTDRFGAARGPVVFGWIFTGHQLGAAFAAYGGGLVRTGLGSYATATLVSGTLCVLAALVALRVERPAVRAAAA